MWKMKVKKIGSEKIWEEPIMVKTDDFSWTYMKIKGTHDMAKDNARKVVDYFNSTLKSDEEPREVVSVFFEDKNERIRY